MAAQYIKLLLMAAFWGGTFVAGRLVSADMGPSSAAFLRFTVASLCLVAIMSRFGGLRMLTAKQFIPACLLGLTGVFAYNVCFFTGLQTVDAGRAAVIIAMNPIGVAIGAALFFGEAMTRRKALGILLAVSGAVTAITHGNPLGLAGEAVSSGDLWISCCVLCWCAYSLLGKVAMRDLTPPAAVTWGSILGAAALLPFALAEGMIGSLGEYSATSWASVFYLGFFGTVLGFTWYYEGVNRIGASRAAVFINFVPVWGILLGWLMLGEGIDLSLAAGVVLVLSGVWLANRPGKGGRGGDQAVQTASPAAAGEAGGTA